MSSNDGMGKGNKSGGYEMTKLEKEIKIAEKNVLHFLKVKDLKELLSDIPDEWYITFTSSETKHHITHVTSVGILESESEYPNKCLSFCCDDHSISEETDYTSEVLFDCFENMEDKECE